MKLIFKKILAYINNTHNNKAYDIEEEIYKVLIKNLKNAGGDFADVPATYKEFNEELLKLEEKWMNKQD
jgi:hypothetical protein